MINTNPNNLSPFLNAALIYANSGWPVIPLYEPINFNVCSCGKSDCSSVGKHPRTPHGLKDATTDQYTIFQWWSKWPNANIGILTGNESGIIAIDIDPRHNGLETFQKITNELGSLPPTLIAATGGGGLHYTFKHPRQPIKTASNVLGPGIDIKGDGGYIVAQPSIHASGRYYSFENPSCPVADLPIAWLNRIVTGRAAHKTTGNLKTDSVIPAGQRNGELAKLAGSMRNKGMQETEILAALLEVNSNRCNPPLDESEVEKIAASISNYPAGDKDKKKSQATLLIEIAEETELFHNEGGLDSDVFSTITVNNHYENLSVKSKAFREWLSLQYFTRHGKAPGAQALQDALNNIAAKAKFSGAEKKTFVRIGWHNETVYIDLGNNTWDAIAVNADSWFIVKSSNIPIKFIRKRGMKELAIPEQGGSIFELRKLVNLPDDNHWILYVAWLIMGLCPQGPYPILIVNGEQGSAKSCLCRITRELLDPNAAPLRRPPKDERDLMISAANGWIVAYDNLSGIKPDLADSLCCLATGVGFGTRELYTDDEEKLFSAQRPIILNGIDDLAVRSDLTDRSVCLHLPTIPEEHRQEETAINAQFELLKPRLLGALLTAVSMALRNRPYIKLGKKPRMADFAIWISAAEPALGWPSKTFINAFTSNREHTSIIAVESNSLGEAISKLMEQQPNWAGTPTELLSCLESNVRNLDNKRRPSWPKSASGLSRILNRLAPDLRRLGIEVDHGTDGTGNNRKRIIYLTRSPNI